VFLKMNMESNFLKLRRIQAKVCDFESEVT
jgi:hypothetical protein